MAQGIQIMISSERKPRRIVWLSAFAIFAGSSLLSPVKAQVPDVN
jgi:hypothetical protein